MPNAAEMELIIKATVDQSVRGISQVNQQLDKTVSSAAAASTAMTKASSGINSVATTATKASSALTQQASATADIANATNDAASNASKLAGIVDAGSKQIVESNSIIAKSYDEVSGSINQFAEDFNSKWTPVVEQAQKDAEIFKVIPESLREMGQGFQTNDVSANLAAMAVAAGATDSAIDQLVQQTASFLKLDESVRQLLLSIEGLDPEIRQFAQDGQGSIAQLTAAFTALKEKATFTTNPQQLLNYNLAIEQLSKQINNAKTAATQFSPALGKISPVASTANFAVTNLGRVLQDLPFGFIGIANNLVPLQESLQALSREAKSSGTTLLSALGSALMGPGGIGFGLSLVTAALTAASFGLSAWTRGFGGAKDKIDEAKKAQEDFVKSLNDAESGVLANSVSLQAYVNIARDSTRPLEQRNEALKEANKILGEHGEKLTLVNINTKAATDEINLFTQALIAQTLASKFADKIADLFIKQRDAIKQYTAAQNDLKLADQQAAVLLKGQIGQRGVASAAIELHASALDKLTDATTNYKNITQDLSSKSSELNDLISKSTSIFSQLGTKSKETGADLDKVSKILEQLKLDREELQGDWKILQVDKPLKDIELIQSTVEKLRAIKGTEAVVIKLKAEIDSESLSAVGGQLQKQFGDLKNFKLPEITLPAPKVAPIKIGVDLDTDETNQLKGKVELLSKLLHIELPVNFESLNKDELEKIINAIPSDVKIRLGIQADQSGFKKFIKNLTDSQNALEELNESIVNTSLDTLTQGFADFGKAIGGGGNPFAALFQSFAKGLEELGAALIRYGVLHGIIEKALKATLTSPLGGVLAISAGIALEALGSLLESKVHFAEGGITTAPVLGLVGERGREAIIPLDRLNEFVNRDGQAIDVTIKGELSGDKLKLLVDRVNRRFGKTY